MARVTQAAFRECLATLDVRRARKLWAKTNSHLPQPKNDEEMLIVLHHARTQTKSMHIKQRAYSHAWLTERSLPSGLPDELKPVAERIYPAIKTAVGVAVKSLSGDHERAKHIEKAMSHAVAECYGDGVTDVEVIRARMQEARAKVR